MNYYFPGMVKGVCLTGKLFCKLGGYLKMKFTLVYCFLLLSFLSYSQETGNAAPLPKEYLALQSDSARMRFLMTVISDSLDEAKLNSVYPWSRAGLEMAEKNDNDSMKGIFHYFIAKAYTFLYNEFDSAIAHYKKVIPYFPDKLHKYNIFSVREIMDRYSDLGNKDSAFVYLDMLKAVIDTMPETAPRKVALSTNIATVYQWFGMFKTAILYYQVAVQGNRTNKNFRGLGMALANLAELYNEMEDPKKAIEYAKEALVYLSDVPMPYTQTAANIAELYVNENQIDSALVYLTITEASANRISLKESQINNQNIRSSIYRLQGKYEQAAQLLDSSTRYLSKTDNSWALCRVLLLRAQLDTTLHNYKSAQLPANQALSIAKKNHFVSLAVAALQQLTAISIKTGDHKAAFQYQSEYLQLKDSLTNAKAKSDAADLEISYKTLQKEQQISLLQTENNIKNLQLKSSRQQFVFMLAGVGMLLLLAGIWYYQRQQRNKVKIQKIKAELENQVLRLQMNPHFIFNSLNSIENFIMQNEKRLASDYLNKFARLIRMILDSSRNEVVPVTKDMEALQLYIDLEQLRFNNRFSYKTIVDPALINGDYRVPSLLIQPYVENAIVHGLAHSEEKGLTLTVIATLEDEKIKYTVQDNGIGRNKAAAYNQHNKPYHKSVGLKITEERINIFNKHPEGNGFVHFTDLTDAQNQPVGTKVEIMLNT